MDGHVIKMEKQTEIFLNNLHRNFKFVCNNKTIREGKLILFNFNDFHYTFTLDLSGSKKQFKLPMAFSVTETLSSLKLDYSIDTLCCGMENFIFECKMIQPFEKNNLYDNTVEMVFV